MSEARKRILAMLAEGKITVDQSEELLAALERDEKQKTGAQEQPASSPTRPPLAEEISKFADSVQKTMRDAMRKIEPPSRELKTRMKEFGGWMQTMVGSAFNDFAHMRGQPLDGVEIDVDLTEPAAVSSCRRCRIENLFGSVRVLEGSAFALKVRGRISRSALGTTTPTIWFRENAVRIEHDTAVIGISRSAPVKAILEMELTLPKGIHLDIETDTASVKVAGAFTAGQIQTISGDVALRHVEFEDGGVDTVSGDISLESGAVRGKLRTTSGNVILKGVRLANVGIHSISGDVLIIDADVGDATSVTIETTSGDVAVERAQGPWSRIDAGTRTGNMEIRWQGISKQAGGAGTVAESGTAGASFNVLSTSGDITFA
ncbi:MAG TPA: DUF4097 family beta strand repeat-containing protein [Candidatus Ozemobacteraceae bacterium]|nr:DUF4097 family beta strand repeat-containing protein [Candidatus Ozemobacteraceae bacterium]HQG27147.1 DUF4097 family beta strand repeat-containing protein [Candidatus Ozemobacteraceae bacterium]